MGFVFWMHKANVLDDRSSSIIAKLLWQKQYFERVLMKQKISKIVPSGNKKLENIFGPKRMVISGAENMFTDEVFSNFFVI